MKKNNTYMSPYNVEKFKEILKLNKIETIITKPWSIHPAIPLSIFVLLFITLAIDASCDSIIIEKVENFINDGNESLLVIGFFAMVAFVLLGCFLTNVFVKLKKEKYGNDISKIQNEIFSKILIGYDAKISLNEGFPKEIMEHIYDMASFPISFSSDEGFLCFNYKDTRIKRGLVIKTDHSSEFNGKRIRNYNTCYIFKPNNQNNFCFEVGNNLKKKDCISIDCIDSDKKFNIIGEIDKIQSFFTEKRIDKLSKLNKLIDCDFNIIYQNGLVIMRVYHGTIHPESFDIKYNDTIESYEAKFLNEVEKMKLLVDFINDK